MFPEVEDQLRHRYPRGSAEWTAVQEGERLQPLVAAARSRWSTEVLWMIADGSGLIVDVARMVQGYAALTTRELVALLLSAGAEQESQPSAKQEVAIEEE